VVLSVAGSICDARELSLAFPEACLSVWQAAKK